jgi:hypothetical protein
MVVMRVIGYTEATTSETASIATRKQIPAMSVGGKLHTADIKTSGVAQQGD